MRELTWWQKAVFYQIYPRSFADGNGDGIGDFPGMTSKLDYLRDLGVGALWLSPHYPSPFLDCGYDISDYTGVGPEYGTLADFTVFLREAHARGIRIILDLVLNHTSDLHPWFEESRSSRGNPRRDWYIWRDGRDGGPPNNWVSIFGGSAWELDPLTGQYYYHAFLKEQPDLNWRNTEVKRAMWDAVRFWLDLGVDGFRLDAIATIFEHPDLPDHTLPLPADQVFNANVLSFEEYDRLMQFQVQQPGVHELMKELRAVVDEYPGGRMLVGEDDNIAYYGSGCDELHLVFNFPLMLTERLTPVHIRANQTQRLPSLPPGAWPCNTLGNHDTRRAWSQWGDGIHNAALAQLHLAMLLTLKGTPFLYNGEEIGMADLELTSLDQVRDTAALFQYRVMTEEFNTPPADALKVVFQITRDRCRSPLQWSGAANSGFCPADVEPWLPVNPNYRDGINVAAQESNPESMLAFYRQLIRLRQETPALLSGEYYPVHPQSEDYLAYLRRDSLSGQTCLVILNFSSRKQKTAFRFGAKRARLLFSSHGRKARRLSQLSLAPFEVVIVELI